MLGNNYTFISDVIKDNSMVVRGTGISTIKKNFI